MKRETPRRVPSSPRSLRNCSLPTSTHRAISIPVSSASRSLVYGDPPFYGQVRRDNARLNLRLVCEPVFAGDIREREHLLSASITVANADEVRQLFLSYQAAEVRFSQTLKKEPWGARTFVVMDPDGNLILFAGPAD